MLPLGFCQNLVAEDSNQTNRESECQGPQHPLLVIVPNSKIELKKILFHLQNLLRRPCLKRTR